MRIFAGGREIEIPTDSEGNADVEEIRRVVNIRENRMPIIQRNTGENFIVPTNGQIKLNPYDRFLDAPIAKRG
ncbi:MAG: hypothetical protein K9M75_05585 [Phycisphaerae bacterium]|nr:hypothetical protein [Phycisphaerae bacterium]